MDKFIAYLDETVEKLEVEKEELYSSDREDEANFVKIKMNICEICKSVYQVVVKQVESDSLKDVYIQRMERISSGWIVAYEKAKEHQDVNRIMIEETKIEMLAQINGRFLELV